jgi:hypothetical protein
LGSVHGALGFKPAFTRIALFELPSRADKLNATIAQLNPLADVRVYPGDCNETLTRALREYHGVRGPELRLHRPAGR